MLVFDTKEAIRAYLNSIKTDKTTIGFVPTMGALHLGHLSLIKESLIQNSITIVSIFVNPTQFNNPEDLAKYPRTLERDIQKINSLDSSILVFSPTATDIYEGDIQSEHFDFDGIENQMEGKFRTGHFDGVGTIVKKLFQIISPTNAYFGEKDFQQLQIIRKLVQKNNLSVNIIQCPIYREANGLAMSSRNERLSPLEKEQAALLYRTLLEVKNDFLIKDNYEINSWVASVFENHPTIKLEYFQIADEATLLPCKNNKNKVSCRAFIAVFINNIRLIDTISLN
jgi:pantoate--beta-alanine ligase